MQYVPSNDKEFLATLLCNRALAHYNIGNYQQGLTDAKSCTRFRPEWYKVGHIFDRRQFCFIFKQVSTEETKLFVIWLS